MVIRWVVVVIAGLLAAVVSYVSVAAVLVYSFGVCDEGPCRTPLWQVVFVVIMPTAAGLSAGWAAWRAAGRPGRRRDGQRSRPDTTA